MRKGCTGTIRLGFENLLSWRNACVAGWRAFALQCMRNFMAEQRTAGGAVRDITAGSEKQVFPMIECIRAAGFDRLGRFTLGMYTQ